MEPLQLAQVLAQEHMQVGHKLAELDNKQVEGEFVQLHSASQLLVFDGDVDESGGLKTQVYQVLICERLESCEFEFYDCCINVG